MKRLLLATILIPAGLLFMPGQGNGGGIAVSATDTEAAADGTAFKTEDLASQWAGKKIAWYGTSIPAGYPYHEEQEVYSYANRSIRAVRGSPSNYCVPGGTVRRYKYDGTPCGTSFLDLSQEYNYKTAMVDLIGTPDEPDLFVLDYGVNDAGQDQTDIDMIDPDDPYTTDPGKLPIDTRDIKTFAGSYNFVIDELLKAKSRARFAFVTHFSHDERGGVEDRDFYKKMNVVIEMLAEHWNAPLLRMHRKTGWVNRDGHNLVLVYNPDGIHPATDPTGEAVYILTVLAREFLEDVR